MIRIATKTDIEPIGKSLYFSKYGVATSKKHSSNAC